MSLLRYSKRVLDGGWTCPVEGKFYACADGSNFVGCCTADPCTNGCPDGNIQPVGYKAENHGEFPDASCGTASQFWTCASGNKTFWGCCKSNPCAQGQACPVGDLTPAFLDRPEQFRAYVTDASSTSSTATATATPTESSKSDSNSGGSNTGAIVGGAVGGVLGLAIIVAVLIFFLRRKKRNQKQDGSSGPPYDAVPTGPAGEKHNHHTSTYVDAPPVYTSPNPNTYASPQSGHGTYAHYAEPLSQEVQELPADMSYNAAHSPNAQRFSELPAGAPRTAELESPEATPKPQQTTFSPVMESQDGEISQDLSNRGR